VSGASEIEVERQLVADDPTILALRRALDSHTAAFEVGDEPCNLVDVIAGCLPNDLVHPILTPADGASPPGLAISFDPGFDRYVTFAAEYWASLAHRFPSLKETGLESDDHPTGHLLNVHGGIQ
jgi:hypothetical protein